MDQLNMCKKESKNDEELLQAQSSLWFHTFSHIDSMSLKCAVELGIPDAVHNHGSNEPIALSDLLSLLSISAKKKTHLRRLMRMLTHSGIFLATRNDQGEDLYSLTPVSALLVNNDKHESLSPFVTAMHHPILVDPFRSMTAFFRSGDDQEGGTPFAIEHGCEVWELMSRDPKFNRIFNEAMRCDSKFLTRFLVERCSHVFKGVTSLVDVGGGTGATAAAISEAFPGIKCSVLDLPQVVGSAVNEGMGGGRVEFVSGDMFERVPPADAVLLKWILHDWSDEDSVKILKKCKEAIPCKEKGGGKVIIIDMVIDSSNASSSPHHSSFRTQLYVDMFMMVYAGGVERSETEWSKIFAEAGFTDYKIVACLGERSVIELYP